MKIKICLFIFLFVFTSTTSHAEDAGEKLQQHMNALSGAYSLDGVAGFVGAKAKEYLTVEMGTKCADWMMQSIKDRALKKGFGLPDGRINLKEFLQKDPEAKEAIRLELKNRLKEWMPKVVKTIVKEKLFQNEIAEDAMQEIQGLTDKITSALDTTLNEQLDSLTENWYGKGIEQLNQLLNPMGSKSISIVDVTSLEKTLNNAFNPQNMYTLGSNLIGNAIGDSTVQGIRNHIDGVLQGHLPDEAMQYLKMGQDAFDKYAGELQQYLPGANLQKLVNSVINKPLFTLPTAAYAAILAASAARYYSEAFSDLFINVHALKRAIEVTRVIVWQIKNKDGVQVSLMQIGNLAKGLASQLGMGAKLDGVLDKLTAPINKLEQMTNKLDDMLSMPLDKISAQLKGLTQQIQTQLEQFQQELLKKIKDATKNIEGAFSLDGVLPKDIGLPQDIAALKSKLGIQDGFLGDLGNINILDEAKKLIPEISQVKNKAEDIFNKVNEKFAELFANSASEIIDSVGLSGQTAKILDAEIVPLQNPSDDSPFDPVYLHNGEFIHRKVDIRIPGRGLDFEFIRTYRSRSDFLGELGFNWTHNYDQKVMPYEKGITFVDENGLKTFFAAINPVEYGTAPGAFYTIKKTSSGWEISYPDGQKRRFSEDGLLTGIEDRYKNKLQFFYDTSKKLDYCLDVFGRKIDYVYNDLGLLSQVVDFQGRTIKFEYDNLVQLASVTGPSSFDFPKGRTFRYRYSNQYKDADLIHNLVLIMNPNGQVYLKNVYGNAGDTKDMFTDQLYGDGKTRIHADYIKEPSTTIITTAEGKKHIYIHDKSGHLIERWYGDGDNKKLSARYGYNPDGLLTATIYPSGRAEVFVYDERNPNRSSQMNLKKKIFKSSDSKEADIAWTFEYGDKFNLPSKIVWPEKTEERFSYSDNGCLNKAELVEALKKDKNKVTLYKCNDSGQRVERRDPAGTTTKYDYYDAYGYLKGISYDAAGLNTQVLFEYDPVGNITAVTNPCGARTGYIINEINQVVKEQGPPPFNYIKRYSYDADDNLKKIEIDKKDGVSVFEYDYDILDNLIKRIERISKNETALTQYRYDMDKNLVEEIFPEGNKIEFRYDEAGRLVEKIAAPNTLYRSTESYLYNKDGAIEQLVSPTGGKTLFSYDGHGRWIATLTPGKGILKLKRDELGRALERREYDKDDNILTETIYNYDFPNLLTSAKRHLWRNKYKKDGTWIERKTEYDISGQPIRSIDEAGYATNFEYDPLGRFVKTTDAAGNSISHNYNKCGLMTRSLIMQAGSEDYAVNYSYDEIGRVKTIEEDSGSTWRYEYDELDNVTRITDPGANVEGFSYDGLGQRILHTKNNDCKSGQCTVQTKYIWDKNGRLINLIDDNSHKTEYGYDDMDHLILARNHLGRERLFNYNEDGKVASILNPNGTYIINNYNSGGLLTKRAAHGHEEITEHTYRYDELGRNIESSSFLNGRKMDNNLYVYDSLGKPIYERQRKNEIERSFDLRGYETFIDYPNDGYQHRIRDARGLIADLGEGDKNDAVFRYNGSNDPSEVSFGNNLYIKNYYNENGSVAKIDFTGVTGDTDDTILYTYNLMGSPIKITGLGLISNYEYDSIGRLVASTNAKVNKKYTMDSVDNWSSLTINDIVLSFKSNEVNAYIRIDDKKLEYDENGDLTFDGQQRFAYDALNRLAKVEDKEGKTIAEYYYDAHDRRIAKKVYTDGKASVYEYLYNGWQVIREYKDGKPRHEYMYGNTIDDPISLTVLSGKNKEKFYYLKNGLGSVIAIVDDNGKIIERYKYDDYGSFKIFDNDGNPIGASKIENPYMFAGMRFDNETSLYYARYRYYRPDLGRFISEDPLGFKNEFYAEGADILSTGQKLSPAHRNWGIESRFVPQTLIAGNTDIPRAAEMNLYTYARSNPNVWKDPFGLYIINITEGGDYYFRRGGTQQNIYGATIEVMDDNGTKLGSFKGSTWSDPYWLIKRNQDISNGIDLQAKDVERRIDNPYYEGTHANPMPIHGGYITGVTPGEYIGRFGSAEYRGGIGISLSHDGYASNYVPTLNPNIRQSGRSVASGVKIHCGYSSARYSLGCITIQKDQCDNFFSTISQDETNIHTINISRMTFE